MDKCYEVDGYLIKVHLELHMVHLSANHALRSAMSRSWHNMEVLVGLILKDHRDFFLTPLAVTKNSFIIEILGHAYAYKWLLALRKLANLKILKKLSLHACNVDCGGSGKDTNRWFWDILGFFKPLIFLGVRKWS